MTPPSFHLFSHTHFLHTLILHTAHARRREIWEKFDTTGWQMQGDYVPMPLELRERLVQFFTPHNARLYDYLGRDFGWARSTAT